MTVSAELIILDVGHGNCAIIRHAGRAVIIDAPANSSLMEVLDATGITLIEDLLLTHTDADHISGAIALLMNVARPVRRVHVNPDSKKNSALWIDFRRAVRVATENGTTVIHTSLSTTSPGAVVLETTTALVVYPSPDVALSGVGGKDLNGNRVTQNSMSAVVHVSDSGQPLCLLAADIDKSALDLIASTKTSLAAPILVFPHHGGKPSGYDAKTFAKDMMTHVSPALVVFSMGRNKHSNPRPDIISGVLSAMSASPPYIACTQLSRHCSPTLPAEKSLTTTPGAGRTSGDSCAGSIRIPFGANKLAQVIADLRASHGKFVTTVSNPMCAVLPARRPLATRVT